MCAGTSGRCPHTALWAGPLRPAPFPSTSGSGAAVRGSARGGPGPASGGSGSAVAKMSRGSIEIPLRDTDEVSRARGGGREGDPCRGAGGRCCCPWLCPGLGARVSLAAPVPGSPVCVRPNSRRALVCQGFLVFLRQHIGTGRAADPLCEVISPWL